MTGISVKSIVFGVAIAAMAVSGAQANICDSAAHHAAAETGVPVDVMLTITRLETGRGTPAEPWPWAVNNAGDGSWFPSEDDARSYVFSKVKRGITNIDIGCFQINYRWHADGFRSLDDMFHPELNALYAARFLSELYREFGNWTEAVGAYHSRTSKYADRYLSKFRDLRSDVARMESPAPTKATPAGQPLFGQHGSARPGSVFMTDATRTRPFIQFNRTN